MLQGKEKKNAIIKINQIWLIFFSMLPPPKNPYASTYGIVFFCNTQKDSGMCPPNQTLFLPKKLCFISTQMIQAQGYPKHHFSGLLDTNSYSSLTFPYPFVRSWPMLWLLSYLQYTSKYDILPTTQEHSWGHLSHFFNKKINTSLKQTIVFSNVTGAFCCCYFCVFNLYSY